MSEKKHKKHEKKEKHSKKSSSQNLVSAEIINSTIPAVASAGINTIGKRYPKKVKQN